MIKLRILLICYIICALFMLFSAFWLVKETLITYSVNGPHLQCVKFGENKGAVCWAFP